MPPTPSPGSAVRSEMWGAGAGAHPAQWAWLSSTLLLASWAGRGRGRAGHRQEQCNPSALTRWAAGLSCLRTLSILKVGFQRRPGGGAGQYGGVAGLGGVSMLQQKAGVGQQAGPGQLAGLEVKLAGGRALPVSTAQLSSTALTDVCGQQVSSRPASASSGPGSHPGPPAGPPTPGSRPDQVSSSSNGAGREGQELGPDGAPLLKCTNCRGEISHGVWSMACRRGCD